jgi:hypothetical protein
MIVAGVLLLLLGYFLPIPILETLGIILLIIGVVLLCLGAAGRPLAGRRYWY